MNKKLKIYYIRQNDLYIIINYTSFTIFFLI